MKIAPPLGTIIDDILKRLKVLEDIVFKLKEVDGLQKKWEEIKKLKDDYLY